MRVGWLQWGWVKAGHLMCSREAIDTPVWRHVASMCLRVLLGGIAAVNHDGLARDVAGRIAGQENSQAMDV